MKAFLAEQGRVHLFIYSYILEPHLIILKMPKSQTDSIAVSMTSTKQEHLIFKAEEILHLKHSLISKRL